MKKLIFLMMMMLAATSAYAANEQYKGGAGCGADSIESASSLLSGLGVRTVTSLIRVGQTITAISRTSNVVTVTLSAAYSSNSNLKAGQSIVISGVSGFNGTFVIATATTQSSFTYAETAANATGIVDATSIAGGNYTTLTAWVADRAADITAASGRNSIEVAECYNDWGSGLNDVVTITGFTTDSTHYLKVTVPVSERHTGIAKSGFFIDPTADSIVFDVSASYTRIEWVDIADFTSASTQYKYGIRFSSQYCTVNNCLIHVSASNAYCWGLNLGSDSIAYNNIIYGFNQTNGAGIVDGSYRGKYYNNTIYNCTTGFNVSSSNQQVQRNNIVYNCTTAWNGNGTSSDDDYNLTNAGTATGGAHDVTGATLTFVNTTAGSENLHLTASCAAAIGAGADLSATFTTDIDASRRPNNLWDIGAAQYIPGALTVTAPAGNATITVQKGDGKNLDDFKLIFSETDDGVSSAQRGSGVKGTWGTNLCSATSLLIETNTGQDAATGVMDILQQTATEVIIQNVYTGTAAVTETYHIYADGKIVVDAVGATAAAVFDPDFTVTSSAARTGGGGYENMVEVIETAAASATDYTTPGTLSMTTGTAESTRRFDYNADGFEEGQGAYSVIAANNLLQFDLNGSTTARYKPRFMIEEFYPQSGTGPTPHILFHSRLDSATDVTSPQKGTGGTVVGGATFSSGTIRGSGLLCDANGKYASIPRSGNVGNKGTIQFWYKETATPGLYGSFFTGSTNSRFMLYREASNNALTFLYASGTYVTWSGLTDNVFDGYWHHLSVFWDDTTDIVGFAIDGQIKQIQKVSDFSVATDYTNLYIGGNDSYTVGGIIDDFYIYNDVILPYGAYFTDWVNSYARPHPDVTLYDKCNSAANHTAEIGGSVTTANITTAIGVDGVANSAILLDNGGDYLDFSTLLVDKDKGSVSFWWKYTGTYPSYTNLFRVYVDASNYFMVGPGDTANQFYMVKIVGGSDSSGYTSWNSAGLVANQWYHIRATWDLGTNGTGTKLYVDGVLRASNTNTTSLVGTVSNVRMIGANIGPSVVDEYYITSSPYTPPIQTAYGKPIRQPGMVVKGANPVVGSGYNASATPSSASYIMQYLSNVTAAGTTFNIGEADTVGPNIVSATTYDTNNDGYVEEILLTFSENVLDSSIPTANASQLTWGGVACTAVDSVTAASSGGGGSTASNSGDPKVANDKYVTLFTSTSNKVLGTGALATTFTLAAGKFTDAVGNAAPTNSSVTVVDKAKPVLMDVYLADAGTAGVFNASGDRMDLVFSEGLSALPSVANLQSSLTFAGGTTVNGSNIPADVGSSLFTTRFTNDSIRLTYVATSSTNLLTPGTTTVQASPGTYVTDSSSNTANATTAAATSQTLPSGVVSIYRSVGPGQTSAKVTYATVGAMSITSGVATFAATPGVNIGVGDALQYASDTKLVFIHSRNSDGTQYTVRTAAGAVPANQASDSTWSIFRAYTSLANAEKGVENTGIALALRNFDDWTAGGTAATDDVGKNLVSALQMWYIACYADAADTTAVTVDGWTTDATHYMTIYTPTSTSQVGTSQRHSGKWNTNAYRLEVASTDFVIYLLDDYVHLDGIQINAKGSGGYWNSGVNTDTSSYNIYVSNCIIKNTATGATYSDRWGIYAAGSNGRLRYLWNNIIYGFKYGAEVTTGGIINDYSAIYSYNNTLYNNGVGIKGSYDYQRVKNNICYNNAADYSGTFNSNSTNNLSKDGNAPPYNTYYTGKTLTFTNTTAGSEDLHLASTDTDAIAKGADLSADPNLAFTTDIDGQTRSGAWSIGADQLPTQIYYSVGTSTADLKTAANISIDSTGTATFTAAQPNNIGVGDKIDYHTTNTIAYITGRTSPTVYTVRTATGAIPPVVSGQTVNSIKRAFNTLSSALPSGAGSGAKLTLGYTDLVTSNYVLNIPCYGDTNADTAAVAISGWTTGANNYIKVYTPTSTSEVGTSQRHSGKWSTSGYRLEVVLSGSYPSILSISNDYVRVEGLQMYGSGGGSIYSSGVSAAGQAVSNELRISHNIIKGNINTASYGAGIYIHNGIYERVYSEYRAF